MSSTESVRSGIRTALVFVFAASTALLVACGNDQQASKKDASRDNDTIPSLQAKLDSRKAAFTESAHPDMVNTFERGFAEVAESGVLESALREGDMAPMFSLPGATGDTVALGELLARGPIVIVWYRGGWCPYCNIQLNDMQVVLPRLRELGAELVAISPEMPDSALSTKERSALAFPVLSDPGNEIARQFGIVYSIPADVRQAFEGMLDIPSYNGDSSWELPLAVTYVIDRDGVIRYAFVDPDYRKRAEPSAVIAALQRLHGA